MSHVCTINTESVFAADASYVNTTEFGTPCEIILSALNLNFVLSTFFTGESFFAEKIIKVAERSNTTDTKETGMANADFCYFNFPDNCKRYL